MGFEYLGNDSEFFDILVIIRSVPRAGLIVHFVETDPLGQGVDRGRWSNILDRVYDTYGSRKPIIVSESGCSYFSVKKQTDITDFAVKQMKDYYTYLPIKYPNLKMAVLFDREDAGGRQFLLSRNSAVLKAYKRGITSSPPRPYCVTWR